MRPRFVGHEGIGEHGLKQAGSLLVTHFEPGESGFQLIASGSARPARLVGERLFIGQSDDRMKHAVVQEVKRKRESGVASPRAEFLLAGGAPGGEETAHDDSDVEEVGVRRSGLERIRVDGGVPGVAGQVAGRADGCVEISAVPRERMQIGQSTHRIAGDLGGNGSVLADVGAVVAGYSAVGLLNSRVKKPAAGVFQK